MTNMKVKVRQATMADAPRIAEIVEEVLYEYKIPAAINATLSDLDELEGKYLSGFFGVLENEFGFIIGTLGLYPLSSNKAEIRKLYLIDNYRGKGFGKCMLQFLIDKAKELGYKSVKLDTAAAFLQAIGLYKSLGFKEQQPTGQTSVCDKHFIMDL